MQVIIVVAILSPYSEDYWQLWEDIKAFPGVTTSLFWAWVLWCDVLFTVFLLSILTSICCFSRDITIIKQVNKYTRGVAIKSASSVSSLSPVSDESSQERKDNTKSDSTMGSKKEKSSDVDEAKDEKQMEMERLNEELEMIEMMTNSQETSNKLAIKTVKKDSMQKSKFFDLFKLNSNKKSMDVIEYEFETSKGHYKHLYLVLVNMLLFVASLVYYWLILYVTVFDQESKLTNYQRYIVANILFFVIKILSKVIGKRIDLNKDATSCSIQVYIGIFFSVLYYYTLRVLFTNWNDSHSGIMLGIATNIITELLTGCVRSSEWYFNITSPLCKELKNRAIIGYITDKMVDVNTTFRQWQKQICVNIVFNFVISVSSLIFLLVRFIFMLPGVAWFVSEVEKKVNINNGYIVNGYNYKIEINVNYQIFVILILFLVFDILIFAIQVKFTAIDALAIMTTDQIYRQYRRVIGLLVLLWGTYYCIFGVIDRYLIQIELQL